MIMHVRIRVCVCAHNIEPLDELSSRSYIYYHESSLLNKIYAFKEFTIK